MNLSGSWQYIEDVARSRLAHNKTKRHVYSYGPGIEVIGVAGEIIVRRFLGLEEKVHEGFDHGVDITYYGMRLDVKATILTPNANYRFLQWAHWKKVAAEYIVMTVVDPINHLGTVIGYATREEILASPINYTRTTPCHETPFTQLHPAWELIVEACRRRTAEALRFPTDAGDARQESHHRFPTLETFDGGRQQENAHRRLERHKISPDALLIPRLSNGRAGGMAYVSRD